MTKQSIARRNASLGHVLRQVDCHAALAMTSSSRYGRGTPRSYSHHACEARGHAPLSRSQGQYRYASLRGGTTKLNRIVYIITLPPCVIARKNDEAIYSATKLHVLRQVDCHAALAMTCTTRYGRGTPRPSYICSRKKQTTYTVKINHNPTTKGGDKRGDSRTRSDSRKLHIVCRFGTAPAPSDQG